MEAVASLVVLAAAERERDTDERATEAGGAVAGLGSCCDHTMSPFRHQSVMKP